jgi:molybdopterin adenylyltransferase
MSQIVSIVYKPADVEQHPEGNFARVPLNEARLIVDYGIEGDQNGGRIDRQLNIMGAEILSSLNERGFKTAPGEMGEQIILGGVDVGALQPGDTLVIGEAVRVEVIKNRTGCTRFQRIQGHPPSEAVGQLGVIARVVTEGVIRLGDSVQVEPAAVRAES